jgi:hypothetical protein
MAKNSGWIAGLKCSDGHRGAEGQGHAIQAGLVLPGAEVALGGLRS